MGKKRGHYVKVGKGKKAKYKVNSGAWELSYNNYYGGWIVEEIDPKPRSGSSGVGHPLISRRLSTKEMYYALWMAATAIESRKRKR
jgi:hypothetical protein